MNNTQFKEKIVDIGIRLNGIFCGYDVVLNKKLEFNIRMRKIPTKPNLKPGEVVIIKAYDIEKVAGFIAKEAISTVLALYDLQDGEDKQYKIKELDPQIKHQIELIKYNIIGEFIKEITPIKQTQFYYSLGIKNAEQLVDGTDTIPIY